ncbi:MAG: universal stress protein [Planctomycetota bacterium]
MSVETIVVGIDESPGSRAALTWATDLSDQLGARLVLVHVYQPLAHLEELAPGKSLQDLRDECRARMQELFEGELERRSVSHELSILEGEPADVLVDVAKTVGADLVVVGARRQGPLQSLILGSTSARLARLTPIPVVIIHEQEVMT